MGMLIDGRWSDEDRAIRAGAFVRGASRYAQDISPETVAAIGREPGRFHLIASVSCPWSHRTILVRALKGLAGVLPLRVAGGTRHEGYPVDGGAPWQVPGAGRTAVHVHELYAMSDPAYTGRATVPILWDGATGRIISNASAKIMRALDAVVPPRKTADFTLVPEHLGCRIDALNAQIHDRLANGVYRAGLAQCQSAYDDAVSDVFGMLDLLEVRLAESRYLFGNLISETDWHLFAVLVRFDAVYSTHFRCTRRRLVDYPNLWAYARDLFGWPGVAGTVDFTAIRDGYYLNDGDHNPHGILAEAPETDWHAPHGRSALGPARKAWRNGISVEDGPE